MLVFYFYLLIFSYFHIFIDSLLQLAFFYWATIFYIGTL